MFSVFFSSIVSIQVCELLQRFDIYLGNLQINDNSLDFD